MKPGVSCIHGVIERNRLPEMGSKTESKARHDIHQNLRLRQPNLAKLKKVIKTSYYYQVSSFVSFCSFHR